MIVHTLGNLERVRDSRQAKRTIAQFLCCLIRNFACTRGSREATAFDQSRNCRCCRIKGFLIVVNVQVILCQRCTQQGGHRFAKPRSRAGQNRLLKDFDRFLASPHRDKSIRDELG